MPPVDVSRSALLRFGTFEVDLRSGDLRKAGVRIALQDQPFRVLARLLAHPGELVTRDELRRELWPSDTFVDFEHGLNVAIKRLRDALGDVADAPRFVETLPRRGYRFIAPVAPAGRRPETDASETETEPQSRGRRRFGAWAVAGLTVGVGIIGAVMLIVNRRPAPLTEGDSILVADFVNETGDEVFNGTLRQGLTVQLAQSPHFSIVPRERVRDTLKQMTRSPDDPVVGEVARDLCQRVGAKVTVSGNIGSLGHHYVIGLETLNCLSGETVAVEQAEVSGRERVLGALSSSASRLRRRLGESLASIGRFDVPLERATTPSLEALKAFTIGQDVLVRSGDSERATSFLKRAIELDANFAMAYAKLSALSANLGRPEDEVRYAQEAHARREHLTEPERFYIDKRYCAVLYGPGFRTDCVMKVNELWKRTYPREWMPYAGLASGHLTRGEYEAALEHGLEAMRLNPDEGFGYLWVAEAYLGLNRFADARRVTDQALARHLMEEWIREQRFRLAFLAGDEAAMASERQAVAGMEVEAQVAEEESEIAAFHGRLRESRRFRTRAERLALGRSAPTLNLLARGAIIDAAVGVPARIPDVSGPMPDVARYNLAVAALLSGNLQRAATMLGSEEVPADNLPLVASAHVLLAVESGDRSAIERLPDDVSRRLGQPTRFVPPYLRGLAYLRAGDGPGAAAEFQRIIDHRGVDPTSPLYPLAYLQHGRASALGGDVSKARHDYETFLTYWRDADADVLILKQAKAEYAALLPARD